MLSALLTRACCTLHDVRVLKLDDEHRLVSWCIRHRNRDSSDTARKPRGVQYTVDDARNETRTVETRILLGHGDERVSDRLILSNHICSRHVRRTCVLDTSTVGRCESGVCDTTTTKCCPQVKVKKKYSLTSHKISPSANVFSSLGGSFTRTSRTDECGADRSQHNGRILT